MDGYEAMAILQHTLIQLVISDVMMPGMDGLELCSTIKSNPDLNHIPVILLTGKDTLQSKIQGLKTGADAYIEKPFSLDHLNAQIDNLLENRLILKESYARSPLLPINSIPFTKEDEAFLETINGSDPAQPARYGSGCGKNRWFDEHEQVYLVS